MFDFVSPAVVARRKRERQNQEMVQCVQERKVEFTRECVVFYKKKHTNEA